MRRLLSDRLPGAIGAHAEPCVARTLLLQHFFGGKLGVVVTTSRTLLPPFWRCGPGRDNRVCSGDGPPPPRRNFVRQKPPLMHGSYYEKIDEADNELASQSTLHRAASAGSRESKESRNWAGTMSHTMSRPSLPAVSLPGSPRTGMWAPRSNSSPREGQPEADASNRGQSSGSASPRTSLAGASPRGNPPSSGLTRPTQPHRGVLC